MPYSLSSFEDTRNILFQRRARAAALADNMLMQKDLVNMDDVRQRIAATLAEKGLSKRSVSLASGNGPGYVHSILAEGKEPTVSNLAAVCDAMGVSLSFILYGHEMSAETEVIIQLLERFPSKRDSILALLRP